jgi:hypothetical protein
MSLTPVLFLDLELVEAKQQAIDESGGEESEDEWNYVKVNENREELAALEETSEAIIDSKLDLLRRADQPEEVRNRRNVRKVRKELNLSVFLCLAVGRGILFRSRKTSRDQRGGFRRKQARRSAIQQLCKGFITQPRSR